MTCRSFLYTYVCVHVGSRHDIFWLFISSAIILSQICIHSQIFTIVMNNNKQLWDFAKSISDSNVCEKKSTKPFIPHRIDGLLSYLASHFYSQHKLNQIQHYRQSIKRLLKIKNWSSLNRILKFSLTIYDPTPSFLCSIYARFSNMNTLNLTCYYVTSNGFSFKSLAFRWTSHL